MPLPAITTSVDDVQTLTMEEKRIVGELINKYNALIGLVNSTSEEEKDTSPGSEAKKGIKGKFLQAAKSLEERDLRKVKSEFLRSLGIDVKSYLEASRKEKTKESIARDTEIIGMLSKTRQCIVTAIDRPDTKKRNIDEAGRSLMQCTEKISAMAATPAGKVVGVFSVAAEAAKATLRRGSKTGSPEKGETLHPMELKRKETETAVKHALATSGHVTDPNLPLGVVNAKTLEERYGKGGLKTVGTSPDKESKGKVIPPPVPSRPKTGPGSKHG